MELKNLTRQICPPLLWRFAGALKRRVVKSGGVAVRTAVVATGPRVTHCGPRSELRGQVDMRSTKSSIFVGSDCLIEGTLVTEKEGSIIRIGNNVFIGGGTLLDCASLIEIEDDVLISYGGIIADSDNHSISYSRRRGDLARWKAGAYDWSQAPMKPILIRRGAWLGARVIVLKGVTIGEGSVVGAGSVVTRDVAPYTLVAGNPARLIREIPLNDR